ncbi:ABC transporter substrate-binding protein [Blastococcus brunescens]|uniref:ABC transporter substrate-binding protein n=1 Tax=Blastococcus brunescens TaxID=1564165 RepID=A0ABZ1B5R4_9ACTN|nr:ABC transporter substrate-binding protein [Blastococcus sp. BMG 8361]WRL66144.1 ABC transporter substrate-binding protein [Blastococcus sp. BMG 8361]
MLGQPVQLIEGDSGDASTDTATQTVDRLLQAGADVIVGAASSGVSLTVIDAITQAGVLQISPANTSDQFTTYNDNNLYFRTAPPDTLQARALADLIIEDGNNTVGILALNDPYGTGLAENTVQNLMDAGLSEDAIQSITYDPQAANFDSEVQEMVDFNPDAIVVIGFEESSRIIEGSTRTASARSADSALRVLDPVVQGSGPAPIRCRATVLSGDLMARWWVVAPT